jgi:hypothetical protein
MSEINEIKDILLQQNEERKGMSKKLDDIHFAIYGNKEAKIEGIAYKVNSHERYIAKDRAYKNKIAGGFIVLSALWFILLDYLKDWFNKWFH